MTRLTIATKEPHFNELMALHEKYKYRKTKSEIFDLWQKAIAPELPKITFTNFVSHLKKLKEKEIDNKIEAEGKKDIEQIETGRAMGLVEIENKLKVTTGDLLEEADSIMQEHKENGVPLKERYFVLGIVNQVWGRVQKEKELAIKAHAEKRESVGMFAKLLRGALSGEFTMKDVELMKNTYGNPIPTIESNTERSIAGTN